MAKKVAARAKGETAKAKKLDDVAITVTSREPSHEAIAERAFALYLARGGIGGGEMNDWLRAEQELRTGA